MMVMLAGWTYSNHFQTPTNFDVCVQETVWLQLAAGLSRLLLMDLMPRIQGGHRLMPPSNW
jgi:hypothetical protein